MARKLTQDKLEQAITQLRANGYTVLTPGEQTVALNDSDMRRIRVIEVVAEDLFVGEAGLRSQLVSMAITKLYADEEIQKRIAQA